MRKTLLYILLPFCITLQAQWVSVPPGGLIEFESVLVDDAQQFLVAGENGAAFRTTDGGNTWAPVTGLGVESIRDFLRLDAVTILAASDGVVLRSTDNGTTWISISTPATDDLHALTRNGNTVVAVGRSGGIIRSNDAGHTWTAQISGTAERIFCVAAITATDYVAGGKNGTFLRSTNGGTTWLPGSLSLDDDWVGIHFFSTAPLTGLICGEDGTMARTTDGGVTWTAISTGPTMGFGGLGSANDSVVYAAGSTGTALRSTDMGLTWNTMTSPAFSTLNAIHVGNGMAVAAGANGTVIKLGSSGVGIAEHRSITGVALFPNPARSSVTVNWSGAYSGSMNITLIDASGRVVREQAVGRGAAEMNQVVLDLYGLDTGDYMVRLISESGTTAAECLHVL